MTRELSPEVLAAVLTGQMKIRELRTEPELGAKFDVRALHEVVLGSGSVPLTVLAENVRQWIVSEKARAN
jgi:prolyl oligopeptidase